MEAVIVASVVLASITEYLRLGKLQITTTTTTTLFITLKLVKSKNKVSAGSFCDGESGLCFQDTASSRGGTSMSSLGQGQKGKVNVLSSHRCSRASN